MLGDILFAFAGAAAGYFAARFADHLFGLDDLSRQLADWWHQNLPSFRFTYGGATT